MLVIFIIEFLLLHNPTVFPTKSFVIYYIPTFSHSRMEHYFFSYLHTCEVDLFGNSAIVAIKSDIHVKSIKVTSGFNLRRMKKSARWRCHAEKSKTNLKTLVSPLWTRPQGSQGYQKMRQDPQNMPYEVCCANT